jgi:hypothetical protein
LAINQDLLRELGIIMNFNDKTIIRDTDTIPMNDSNICTSSSAVPLIEDYMSANEPQTLRDEYS